MRVRNLIDNFDHELDQLLEEDTRSQARYSKSQVRSIINTALTRAMATTLEQNSDIVFNSKVNKT